MKWPVKRIEHEKAFCKRFVQQLEKLRALRKTKHLWDFDYRHIANEREGNRQKQYELMGVKKGDADYQFIWVTLEEVKSLKPETPGSLRDIRSHVGYIECKHYRGKKPIHEVTEKERVSLLTPAQLLFREYRLKASGRYAICLSDGEMLDTLIRWGALLP